MGEVYRARDTRLDRSVAIKVLPAAIAGNASLRDRFEREARVISSLSHPHICTLFDVGHENGCSYLVMEYLDGETLADRLTRGPLPTEQVLRYGMQIADALAAAHRHGVIHRDLKPGNVMLTKSGAKLLDFGLAKSAAPVLDFDGATEHKPLTQEGTILGTFQYMAPEQLEGLEADARTDIFALGVLLYEMATGRRAFEGKTRTSLIAAIVSGEVKPMSQIQPLTPPALEHVVKKCLSKDPKDRWQSASDIAEELRWISEAGSQAGVATRTVMTRRRREQILLALALALAIATATLATLYLRERDRAVQPFVSDLAAPGGARFNAVGDEGGPVVVSPNGSFVVFSVADGAMTRLWLRSLDSGDARPLTGTEGGMFPFWSPDSRNLAFFAGGQLKRVDIVGGLPINIAAAPVSRGGAWGPGDVIVFTPATLDAIYRVPASGGKAVAVTKLDFSQHTSHRWPSFLPDSKHFLYLASNHQDPSGGSNAVYIGSIDGDAPRLLVRSLSNAVYSNGYLLFNREKTLFAQPMSSEGSIKGQPIPVAENVLYDSGIWRGGFSVSDTGLLVYHAGQGSIGSRLVWMDRSGKGIGVIGERDMYWDVQISPDQQKVAICIGDPGRLMWVFDLQRNTRTRLPLDARATGTPFWSADGSTLYAGTAQQDGFHIVAKRLKGGSSTTTNISKFSGDAFGLTVSPDGKTLIFDSRGDLWRTSADGRSQAMQVTSTRNSNEYDPLFSPDGRWLSYTSNENGKDDVFIASATDVTQKWQVSTGGGRLARWRGDGREIFFLDNENKINGVPIRLEQSGLEIGNPHPLFGIVPRVATRAYDVTADGQRFLVNSLADQPSPTIRIVADWKRALK